MAKQIVLYNDHTDLFEAGYVGFSWGYLFLSFLVFFDRKDREWLVIYFLSILLYILLMFMIIDMGMIFVSLFAFFFVSSIYTNFDWGVL